MHRFAVPGAASRVLVLGVTPELVRLPWSTGTCLVAIDRSEAMIASVWPGNEYIDAMVTCGLWQQAPLADASIDVAVGDGCLTVLPSSRDYRGFFQEVHRVLAPNGALVLRSFVKPPAAHALEAIATAVHHGQVGSMHALNWRIAMALQTSDEAGIAVTHIRKAFDDIFPDRAWLAASTGWPRPAIDTIDAYAQSDAIYSFPEIESVSLACDGLFRTAAIAYPDYELGECCPTHHY